MGKSSRSFWLFKKICHLTWPGIQAGPFPWIPILQMSKVKDPIQTPLGQTPGSSLAFIIMPGMTTNVAMTIIPGTPPPNTQGSPKSDSGSQHAQHCVSRWPKVLSWRDTGSYAFSSTQPAQAHLGWVAIPHGLSWASMTNCLET